MSTPVVLEVEQINRHFAGTVAVRDVSLSIKRGARHGIIGPNGAGKTTLFNLISGWTRANSGTVRLNGERIDRLGSEQIVRRGLARTFQYAQLCPTFTVHTTVALALQSKQRLLYAFLKPLSAYGKLQATAHEIISRVGLDAYADTQVSELSYGIQKQLEVAVALATDPDVLLLDEPTAGLSQAESQEMLQLLRQLSPEMTILIIEHDMDVLFGLAESVTVLNAGEILSEGTVDDIRNDPRVREAYMGTTDDGRLKWSRS